MRKPRAEWKTINDFAAQLDEFDLRYAWRDSDTAASVLLDIDFQIICCSGAMLGGSSNSTSVWGKLSDAWLHGGSLGNLGTAYAQIGRIRDAIECGEQALASPARLAIAITKAAWLGNLGAATPILGRPSRAIALQASLSHRS